MSVPEQRLNVMESWPIYDTIIICKELFGAESNTPGFFNTFNQFAARQDHSLFKTRSEAIAGLAYNNQQSQDRVDFAYHAFSIGISFFAPSNCLQWKGLLVGAETPETLLSVLWTIDLPRLIGVELRIGQDVKLTGTCYRLPPGYGPFGAGATMGGDDANGSDLGDSPMPQFIFVANQGMPDVANRFTFKPPVDIPRNETIEVKLYLSDIARQILTQIRGPESALQTIDETEGALFSQIPGRFGIQASLWGIREVQQRGNLHK